MEPFHRKLRNLDISLEVLSNARDGFHAKLGNFEIVAVTSTGNGLKNLVKVLLRCFDLLWIV